MTQDSASITASDPSAQGVLIFGASGGVGQTLARHYAAAGVAVHLAGRDVSAIAAEVGGGSSTVDINDSTSFTDAVKAAADSLPALTGVANCIGSVLLKPAHLITDDEFAETLRINLFTAFFVVREAAKAMRKSGGSVVLCSTAAAQVGLANHEGIAAAKAGIDGLVRSAAATYGSRNLRVNSVAPGLVKSEMTRRIWESEVSANASQEMHVLGRLGEPDDIARAIAFLLDPVNDWITGQTLGVDGGLGGVISRPRTKA